MIALLLSTFGIIFIAELPDKTALAALVLATQYPPRQVILGTWLAFLVQTLVAVAAGSLLQLLPTQPVRVGAGIGFLVFAILALRRKAPDELNTEGAEVVPARGRHLAPWIAGSLDRQLPSRVRGRVG
ncbi:MAG: TMEM165/GDT1 family protein [Chloroflexi bacterium]|nr:TMEM165/GDT1 family protein [Chloroflexota bacterium]